MTYKSETATEVSNSVKCISRFVQRPMKLSLAFLLLVVLIAPVSGIDAVHKRSYPNPSEASIFSSHAVLRSSCSSTRYPDLCFSSIAAVPSFSSSLHHHRDVIKAALNVTISNVEGAFFKIEKLKQRMRGLTPRENVAVHDCLENVDNTLDELRKTEEALKKYPKKKSLSRHADDFNILLSAAMTNQDSCIDGFSHNETDRKVRKVLIKRVTNNYRLCGNTLAMIRNMTDTDMLNERYERGRKVLEEVGDDGFPSWLSAGDRRLLQSSTVTPNVVVAADGSGDYTTVSAAVKAAPERSGKRYIIRIKAGVYKENVEVTKKKTNLMFVGDGRSKTIITGSRNVVDGSTTFQSATVAIVGGGFLARDITFQNTAGPSKEQAVALRVGSDLSAFYHCDILAYQDTLYVHSLRQFFRSCLVVGTVDFIFGNAAVVFQDCDIHARRPNSGQRNMVTAQGRDDPNQNTGISIQKCRIGATADLQFVKSSFETYLGRPWKQYSRTVVMQTEISDVINPAGWFEWNGNFALDTLYYAEYKNTGAGSSTANRVKWKGYKVITSATEAGKFTAGNFIGGSNWLASTGFPFTLGL